MMSSDELPVKRIWELDAIRGIAILGVVVVHFVFDLQYFGGCIMEIPLAFELIMTYGSLIFIILSGVCASLGNPLPLRGAFVLMCGVIITSVTFAMYKTGMADSSIIIYFGILHLLGISMLLYPVYRRWPLWLTAIVGVCMIAAGYWLYYHTTVSVKFLVPLGFTYPGFSSSDYFPILPFMGWYMLGTVLGKIVYKNKKTLMPAVNERNPFIRFFCWCGRQSLWIYLFHQPLCYIIVMAIC